MSVRHATRPDTSLWTVFVLVRHGAVTHTIRFHPSVVAIHWDFGSGSLVRLGLSAEHAAWSSEESGVEESTLHAQPPRLPGFLHSTASAVCPSRVQGDPRSASTPSRGEHAGLRLWRACGHASLLRLCVRVLASCSALRREPNSAARYVPDASRACRG